jgi:hypothetical protein
VESLSFSSAMTLSFLISARSRNHYDGCNRGTVLFQKPGNTLIQWFITMNKLVKIYQIPLPCQGKNHGIE